MGTRDTPYTPHFRRKRRAPGRPPKPITDPKNNLRLARLEAGLTQADIADALGISQTVVSLVEHGDNKRMDREKWFLLSDMLGCDVKWLHGWYMRDRLDRLDSGQPQHQPPTAQTPPSSIQ